METAWEADGVSCCLAEWATSAGRRLNAYEWVVFSCLIQLRSTTSLLALQNEVRHDMKNHSNDFNTEDEPHMVFRVVRNVFHNALIFIFNVFNQTF